MTCNKTSQSLQNRAYSSWVEWSVTALLRFDPQVPQVVIYDFVFTLFVVPACPKPVLDWYNQLN